MRNYLNVPPVPESVWKNPVHFIAFGFGVGIVPFAPGTFGTLIAIPFYLLLQPLNVTAYVIITILIALACSWVCDRTSKDIGVEDHQGMCLDEVAGFLVAMINAPRGLGWIVTGVVLFRVFDIWKPWPIRAIDEKMHSGLGMVLDDVLAGVFTFGMLQLLRIFF